MRKILPGVVMAATLAACATRPVQAPSPVLPVRAPAPVEDLDWLFHADTEAGEAALSYGTPHSDDLRLGFRCRPRGASMEIIQIVEAGRPATITLQAGPHRQSWRARSEEEPMSGGRMLTARAEPGSDVLKSFRSVGWLVAIEPDGVADGMASQPGTTAVESFFRWCE